MNKYYPLLPDTQQVESPKDPRTVLRLLSGLKKLRSPYPSEREYFKRNPTVGGMATEDKKIILNDYGDLTESQKHGIYNLENSRLHMKESKNRPRFKLTNEQKKKFSKYSKKKQDILETIASRMFVGDTSAGLTTPEQVKYVENLRKEMGNKKGK
jgi:hypothetical protein